MPRTTDLRDRIANLIDDTAVPLTTADIAERLEANERTVQTHLLELNARNRIVREYVYVETGGQKVGQYVYYRRGGA